MKHPYVKKRINQRGKATFDLYMKVNKDKILNKRITIEKLKNPREEKLVLKILNYMYENYDVFNNEYFSTTEEVIFGILNPIFGSISEVLRNEERFEEIARYEDINKERFKEIIILCHKFF